MSCLKCFNTSNVYEMLSSLHVLYFMLPKINDLYFMILWQCSVHHFFFGGEVGVKKRQKQVDNQTIFFENENENDKKTNNSRQSKIEKKKTILKFRFLRLKWSIPRCIK